MTQNATSYNFHGPYEGGIACTRNDRLIGLYEIGKKSGKQSVRFVECFSSYDEITEFIHSHNGGFFLPHEVVVISGFVSEQMRLNRYLKVGGVVGFEKIFREFEPEIVEIGNDVNKIIVNEFEAHGTLLESGRMLPKNIPYARV